MYILWTFAIVSDDEIQSKGPGGRFDAQYKAHAGVGTFHAEISRR